MRLSDVSSLSGLISKFGRSVKIPLALMIVGLLVLIAPYMYALGMDVTDKSGDYVDGYNAGVNNGYFFGYYMGIQSGMLEGKTFPLGYEPTAVPDYPSAAYKEGFQEGMLIGGERAESDVSAKADFSEPRDLYKSDTVIPMVKLGAVIGAVMIVMGTLLYVISYRTRDWVSIRIGGQGDSGIVVSSASRVDEAVSTESQGSREMITDLGGVIVTIRAGRTSDLLSGVRAVE